MGDLTPGFRGGRSQGWLSACFLGMIFLVSVWSVDADPTFSNYAPNVCYCDLNNHLQNVRSALLTGQDPPPPPSDDPTAVTAGSNSSGTSGTTASDSSDTSGGNSNTNSSSSAGSSKDSSTASDTSSNSGTNTDTNTQSDSSNTGSTASGDFSGSTVSGDSSGSTTSGDSSGTANSDDSTGTVASGDSSGTTVSGDSSGTADSGDSTGTADSGDSSGTTASGDSSGTKDSVDSTGTTVSGDSSGTTVSGDSTGTEDSGDSRTTVSGDSTGTEDSGDSSGTTVSDDSATTTEPGSDNSTGSGGGSGSGKSSKDETSVTKSGGKGTTTAAPTGKRRKRDVDVDDTFYAEEAETIMETPLEISLGSYYGPRMKREADPGLPLVDQKNPLFSFITQKVEYGGIKFSFDYGVEYDEDGTIKNCTCGSGSSVEMSLCLLNLEYQSDLKDTTSELHKQVSNKLLFPVSVILNKGLIAADGVNLFRRLDIKAFKKYGDYTTAVLQVELTKELYQADYHVKNALEPSIRHGEIGPYTTDHEECLVTVDQTPVVPEELPPLWYLRFLCLPIALIVLGGIVVVICVGKRDACNILKW